MIVSRQYEVRKIDQENARRIQHLAGQVYSFCAELHRYYRATYHHWISAGEMMSMLKGQAELHSQTIQGIVQKFHSALDGAVQARKVGTDARLPWRMRWYYAVPFKSTAIRVNGCQVTLAMGKGREPLALTTKEPIPTTSYLELVWESGKYYLMVTQMIEEQARVESDVVVGIDPGEIHCMTLTDGEEAVIITGRGMRTIHQHRNKVLADFSAKMANCKKYSRRWKKLNRAKKRFLSRSNRLIREHNHQATRKAVDWAKEHNAGTVVLGNPHGVREKDCGAKQNQRISQWNYGKIAGYLEYKLALLGIVLLLIDESYTTQTCPNCGHRHKPNGRVYSCRNCGRSFHRDVVGAVNIRDKHRTGIMGQNSPVPIPKYLRSALLRKVPVRKMRKVVDAPTQANVVFEAKAS